MFKFHFIFFSFFPPEFIKVQTYHYTFLYDRDHCMELTRTSIIIWGLSKSGQQCYSERGGRDDKSGHSFLQKAK